MATFAQDLKMSAANSSGSLRRSSLLLELEGGFSYRGIRHRRLSRFQRSLSLILASQAVTALRRSSNIGLAFLLLLLLGPVIVTLTVVAELLGGGLQKKERLGRWATQFYEYELYLPPSSRLARLPVIRQLPAIYNVLRGDMAFIGPRAVSPQENLVRDDRAAWKRYDLRPGLLSLWWVRKRANIAYGNEVGLDLEYVETNSFRGDLGIAVRALPAALFGSDIACAPAEIRFLGIRIDNLTMAEAAAQIVALTRRSELAQVCFVNADCVNLACRDAGYLATLSQAKLVLADGIGVRIAGAWLGQNVRENVNGTDMLPFLCAAAEQANLGLYLLGGQAGVADGAAQWIAERYPRLRISGVRDGYFKADEQRGVINDIRESGADILLVGLGAPRQDRWIADHRNDLGVKVAIGVGGLLDFYSGRIPRAPIWIRELGMEWFYRFWKEPRRMWKRYFVGNTVFLFRIARRRLSSRDRQPLEGAAS
jgi:N-acetylglucosaminyldiphosphoundecaprenol N-acetyl-beta-D-mannosaminyltransferase